MPGLLRLTLPYLADPILGGNPFKPSYVFDNNEARYC